MSASKILISEVGPRDGLQNCRSIMATADKKRWITALAEAGLREIEVGSFVSPKLLPQMTPQRSWRMPEPCRAWTSLYLCPI